MPIYAEKNMRYAHFSEIREKCGIKRNMRQSHIRVKLASLVSIPTVEVNNWASCSRVWLVLRLFKVCIQYVLLYTSYM